jgi:thioredoxin reductase (NADPH)
MPTTAEPLLTRAFMQRDTIAFPTFSLEDLELARECSCGEWREAGEVLFEPGNRDGHFFFILSGALGIVDSSTGEERLVVEHGQGAFIGDIHLFLGRPAVAACRVLEKSELLRLTKAQLRLLLTRSSSISEKVMPALLKRRELMMANGFEGLRVLGGHACLATLAAREFLHRNGVAHRWVDTDEPAGQALLTGLDVAMPQLPVIAWGSHALMENPPLELLASRLGIQANIPEELFDTVIIGSGPAGLGAAVYAASEGLRTLTLDRLGPGGQAGSSSRIENFAGFPAGISGRDLAMQSYLQALKFGALFSAPAAVAGLSRGDDGILKIELSSGQSVSTRSAIIATGVSYRALGVKGLDQLRGCGVYHNATLVEAQLCEGRPVHIIGAGNSAGQAAMFLSRSASRVHLIVRGTNLTKSMSSYLSERVLANPLISVHYATELRGIHGVACLDAVDLEDTATHEMRSEPSAGVFVFIGATPCSDFAPTTVAKDEKGFFLTGPQLAEVPGAWPLDTRPPLPLETSWPGLFAAGDCRSRTAKRVAFAVGDGALAVSCAHDLLGTYA